MAKCKGEMEVFTRVVGYFAPINKFNKGQKAQFHDRVNFVNGVPKHLSMFKKPGPRTPRQLRIYQEVIKNNQRKAI